MTRILVLDNYDSFVFNLVQYLQQLGARTVVMRNDELDLEHGGALDQLRVDGVLISPGPGTPQDAGVSLASVRACAQRSLPMLGVCLGHQALAVAFGATVARAPELLHGKTSLVMHDGTGVLAGLPDPFTATRYHSLTAIRDTVPPELLIQASTASGVIMALRHATLPLHGVQFHPESVLTQGGHRMLANWLAVCGDNRALTLVADLERPVEDLRLAATH